MMQEQQNLAYYLVPNLLNNKQVVNETHEFPNFVKQVNETRLLPNLLNNKQIVNETHEFQNQMKIELVLNTA